MTDPSSYAKCPRSSTEPTCWLPIRTSTSTNSCCKCANPNSTSLRRRLLHSRTCSWPPLPHLPHTTSSDDLVGAPCDVLLQDGCANAWRMGKASIRTPLWKPTFTHNPLPRFLAFGIICISGTVWLRMIVAKALRKCRDWTVRETQLFECVRERGKAIDGHRRYISSTRRWWGSLSGSGKQRA